MDDQTPYIYHCPHALVERIRDQCPFCHALCRCCAACRKNCEHDPADMALVVPRRSLP